MRIALLAAPDSGSAANRDAALSALPGFLAGCRSAVCEGDFGVRLAPLAGIAGAEVLRVAGSSGYLEGLSAAVASLLAWEPDLLVCVGGDGLASYAADAMLRSGRKARMLGVAAGTANVGPIVRASPATLVGMDPAGLEYEAVDAVDVEVEGTHVAFAFNDAVIADTLLGTVDGSTMNLSAAAMLESGGKVPAKPSRDMVTPAFSVRKDGVEAGRSMEAPAQIVVSAMRSGELYGRAVGGVLCASSFLPGAAAMALLDSVVILPGNPERGFSGFARSEHLIFLPGERVEISGLSDKARLIVDGNPFHAGSGPASRVAFVPAPRILEVARVR